MTRREWASWCPMTSACVPGIALLTFETHAKSLSHKNYIYGKGEHGKDSNPLMDVFPWGGFGIMRLRKDPTRLLRITRQALKKPSEPLSSPERH